MKTHTITTFFKNSDMDLEISVSGTVLSVGSGTLLFRGVESETEGFSLDLSAYTSPTTIDCYYVVDRGTGKADLLVDETSREVGKSTFDFSSVPYRPIAKAFNITVPANATDLSNVWLFITKIKGE